MDFLASGKVKGPPRDAKSPVHDNLGMDEFDPNAAPAPEDVAPSKPVYLRAWRKRAGLTQQKLADAVTPPTTKQVIQALESGTMQLTKKWLEKLAPALGTTSGHLLDFDPDDINEAFQAAAEGVPKHRRAEAIQILKVLSNT